MISYEQVPNPLPGVKVKVRHTGHRLSHRGPLKPDGMGLASILCSTRLELNTHRPADSTRKGIPWTIPKRLTWERAALGSVAQDPVQGLSIRRKQGFDPWSLHTQCPVQILKAKKQVETALPCLLQAPLIESLAQSPALLIYLPAWVAHFLFYYFPLLQEHPDVSVGPSALGRTCKDRGRGSVLRTSCMCTAALPGESCCSLTSRNWLHSLQDLASTLTVVPTNALPGKG